MDTLFNNNLFFVYLFACIAIVNYSALKESQKILLIYLMTFGLAFLNILDFGMSVIFLTLSTFIYLEFLSNDNEKQIIIVKFGYKLLDYLFIIIFQYYVCWIIVSLMLIYFRENMQKNPDIKLLLEFGVEPISISMSFISIIIFVICVNKITAQKFKLKSIDTVITDYFSTNPIYKRPHADFDFLFFEMLSDMEDRTYFERKETYSFLSFEFIIIKGRQLGYNFTNWSKHVTKSFQYLRRSKNIRGYSTLEMQLMRMLFVESGYNKKIVRKIFELVYTKIFLKSLKNFYEANIYEYRSEYKEYLLFIYFNNTNTKIAGKNFGSMKSVFPDKAIKKWSKEELFVVCVGLPYRNLTIEEILLIYKDNIAIYGLSEKEIEKIFKSIESRE